MRLVDKGRSGKPGCSSFVFVGVFLCVKNFVLLNGKTIIPVPGLGDCLSSRGKWNMCTFAEWSPRPATSFRPKFQHNLSVRAVKATLKCRATAEISDNTWFPCTVSLIYTSSPKTTQQFRILKPWGRGFRYISCVSVLPSVCPESP